METQVASKDKRHGGGMESTDREKLSEEVKKVTRRRNMNDMKPNLL
jgi:hypothetical protein